MTTTWSLTAGQLIIKAYRKLGLYNSYAGLTNDQTTNAIDILNGMLKGMQADGINIYRQTQIALSVGVGQGLPGNPITPTAVSGVTPLYLGLEDARWVVSPSPNLYERPLGIFTYLQYMQLPNKQSASSSGPSIIMFDKQASASNFYIFPLSSVAGTINASVGRTVNDVNFVTDTLDFPQEWTEGMYYCLADRLQEDGGIAAADPATSQRVTQRAVAFYEKLLNFDRPASVFMQPYGSRGRSRIWRG